MAKSYAYYEKIAKAGNAVTKAIKEGILTRPETCELCNKKPEPIVYRDYTGKTQYRVTIEAHHWNGHDNPLDVWFLCRRCHRKLIGPEYHEGAITREQAKEIIAKKSQSTADFRPQAA